MLLTDELNTQNVLVGGKVQPPEVSLEWSELKVSFRIISEFDLENGT